MCLWNRPGKPEFALTECSLEIGDLIEHFVLLSCDETSALLFIKLTNLTNSKR